MSKRRDDVAQRGAGFASEVLAAWPWDSRGRERVTMESVRRELSDLRLMVAARMRSTHTGGRASVAIEGEGWA